MKNFGMACALVLVACGGSSKSNDTREPAPLAESDEMPTPPADVATKETPPIADPVPDPTPIPEEQPTGPDPAELAAAAAAEAEAARPPVVAAMAEVKAIKDDVALGTVTFERQDDGKVAILGNFTGLKPGAVHAIYIHEHGDCGNKGKAAGAHLNPTKAKHGPPESSERHAGDFGNLTADDAGNANFSMTTDSLTIDGDNPDSIVNRTFVIHSKKDDKKGDGGPALACGVILMRE